MLVFEYVTKGCGNALWLELAKLLASGVVLGAAGAVMLAETLKRPWYLRNLIALASVLAVFTAANHFAHEAGLLAVTVMVSTNRPAHNALACLRYKTEFGADAIFAPRTEEDSDTSNMMMAQSGWQVIALHLPEAVTAAPETSTATSEPTTASVS